MEDTYSCGDSEKFSKHWQKISFPIVPDKEFYLTFISMEINIFIHLEMSLSPYIKPRLVKSLSPMLLPILTLAYFCLFSFGNFLFRIILEQL